MQLTYLGNFGDVNPLEYGGLFMWLEGPPESLSLVKAKLKGVKVGSLHAIVAQNWCDLTGEHENEQKVLITDGLWLDIDELYDPNSWINWKSVASAAGRSTTELLSDPVWAFYDAIWYYGPHEFTGGTGADEFGSFREAAEFLVKRGVPKEEMEYYLDYPTPEEEAEEEED